MGLHVHKETVSIAYAPGGSREAPVHYGECGGSNLPVERALRRLSAKLGVRFRDLKVCYEAGSTGFVLARRLRVLKLEVAVMSSSK